MLNRTILQQLAEIRKDEAETLLNTQKYSGAYYLSGYVIELAFKACIAKETKKYDFPDRKRVSESYVHNLSNLLSLSNLKLEYQRLIGTNRQLEVNWSIVKDWSEESRYDTWTKEQAEAMFGAVTDTNGGVFEWIKQHW